MDFTTLWEQLVPDHLPGIFRQVRFSRHAFACPECIVASVASGGRVLHRRSDKLGERGGPLLCKGRKSYNGYAEPCLMPCQDRYPANYVPLVCNCAYLVF